MRPPRLLAVSDPRPHEGGEAAPRQTGHGWRRWCTELAAAGVDGLQLRDRGLADRDRYERAHDARALLPPPFLLLVSSRADLALAVDADGVHLPAAGLPVAALRRAFGQRFLLGRSTHQPDEVARAQDEGADFAIFGPIFETPSKLGWIAPRGVSSLAQAVKHGLPVLAIGGVDAANAAEVAAAGAWGIAAIRLFAQPARDREVLGALRELWPTSPAP